MGVFIHQRCTCIQKEVYNNGDHMRTVCQAVLDSTQQEHFCFQSSCTVFLTLVLNARQLLQGF